MSLCVCFLPHVISLSSSINDRCTKALLGRCPLTLSFRIALKWFVMQKSNRDLTHLWTKPGFFFLFQMFIRDHSCGQRCELRERWQMTWVSGSYTAFSNLALKSTQRHYYPVGRRSHNPYQIKGEGNSLLRFCVWMARSQCRSICEIGATEPSLENTICQGLYSASQNLNNSQPYMSSKKFLVYSFSVIVSRVTVLCLALRSFTPCMHRLVLSQKLNSLHGAFSPCSPSSLALSSRIPPKSSLYLLNQSNPWALFGFPLWFSNLKMLHNCGLAAFVSLPQGSQVSTIPSQCLETIFISLIHFFFQLFIMTD